MNGHSPEHIKNRIEWRAGKHEFPYLHTDYWPQAPLSLQDAIPDDFLEPTVYSLASTGRGTVVGVDEVLTLNDGVESRFLIDDIRAIQPYPSLNSPEQKQNLDGLKISLGQERTTVVRCEAGSPCFAIWNILLTLAQMQKRGEQSVPPKSDRAGG